MVLELKEKLYTRNVTSRKETDRLCGLGLVLGIGGIGGIGGYGHEDTLVEELR